METFDGKRLSGSLKAFNLPGDWYFRIGLFVSYDSRPPSGFSKNDYTLSNAFGFKF